MNVENIERVVVERVLSISPGIASAEVIHTSPITLPTDEGDGYTGAVVIGAGKVVPGASVTPSQFPSLKGSVHEKTFVANYFAIVIKGEVHVYLENQNILNVLRK